MTELRPSDLVDDTFPDSTAPPSARPSLEDLTEAMRDVVDPELMVNVVDLGLVVQLKLPLRQACAHVQLQRRPLTDGGLHLGIVKAQSIPAGRLGLVHGQIRALEQFIDFAQRLHDVGGNAWLEAKVDNHGVQVRIAWRTGIRCGRRRAGRFRHRRQRRCRR